MLLLSVPLLLLVPLLSITLLHLLPLLHLLLSLLHLLLSLLILLRLFGDQYYTSLRHDDRCLRGRRLLGFVVGLPGSAPHRRLQLFRRHSIEGRFARVEVSDRPATFLSFDRGGCSASPWQWGSGCIVLRPSLDGHVVVPGRRFQRPYAK